MEGNGWKVEFHLIKSLVIQFNVFFERGIKRKNNNHKKSPKIPW